MVKSKYRSAYHCSTLKECLDTESNITFVTFKKLLKAKVYHFYAFDERINANRYILTDMKDYGLPTWLHEYLE